MIVKILLWPAVLTMLLTGIGKAAVPIHTPSHEHNPFFDPSARPVGNVNVDQVVSLKEVPVPEPMAAIITPPIPGPEVDLNFQPLATEIVKDQNALVALGKALFWDMQVGSDGVQACASCHFSAGADIRSRNQISPNLSDANFVKNPLGKTQGDNNFGNPAVPYTANDPTTPPPGPSEPPPPTLDVPGHPGFGPNYDLTKDDFPLNGWLRPTALTPHGEDVTVLEEFSNVSRDTNDIVASQGMRRARFCCVRPGKDVEVGAPLRDIFNITTPGKLQPLSKPRFLRHSLVRRTMPRNSPTIINAVFNFDNLWDGKGSFIFNGVNFFGFRDQKSTLSRNVNGQLTNVFVRVTNSSLASVAAGAALGGITMSFEGRRFADVGRKMLTLRPLAKQLVHPSDSVLGAASRAVLTRGRETGLSFDTYADMVKLAFQDDWWNSAQPITVPRSTSLDDAACNTAVIAATCSAGGKQSRDTFTQMEANFSLFFGLAVQAYEATLVSDNAPFDRFNGAPSPVRENNGQPIPPDPSALTEQQLAGLTIFMDGDANLGTHCADCHVPPVMTGHTVLDFQPDSQGVPSLASGEAIEFMVMGDNDEVANYDHGMYNIGVRRTTEDKGRAAMATCPGCTNPVTGDPLPLSLVELTALREVGKLPPDVARFVPNLPMLRRRVTNGAFKAPNLRNIKYTGPYFHVGDSATLRQVVEFYTRAGNFPNTNLHDKTVDIEGIALFRFPEFDPVAQEAIHDLVAFLAEGLTDPRVAFEKAPFDHPELIVPNGSSRRRANKDEFLEIPAVGRDGRETELPTFLNLDPQEP